MYQLTMILLYQLNEIRNNNLNNVIIGLLHVNHFAGKYDDFQLIIPGNIDVMILVETKLDNSYPTSQFLLFHTLQKRSE